MFDILQDVELQHLRKQLNRDKTHDMDDLKHRLTQVCSYSML